MASFHDLVQQLHAAEEPLGTLYKELRSAAATRVELELASHLSDLQRSQMSHLTLMSDELPGRFVSLGSISSAATKLRDGPGGSHRLIAELPAGMPAIVIDWSGYWAHVQIPGGQRGYVFRDYVHTEGAAKEVPTWQRPG